VPVEGRGGRKDGGGSGRTARSRRRKTVAAAVLLVWLGVLGWYAKRLYLRPEAERLAAAARTLPPGPSYFAVWAGERRVGWARSVADTLPGGDGFLLEDRLELDLAALGLGGRVEVDSRAEIGSAFGLRRFELTAAGALGEIEASGTVAGDSVLELRVRRGGTETVRRVPLSGRVVLVSALPLRLAAEGDARPGDRFRIRTFDPVSLEPREVEFEIEERELRSYPDSAVPDPETEGWVTARRDTVVAWRVSREEAGVRLTAWIDENGRFLELRTGGGLRLERTAFELAFYPWTGRRR